MISTEQKAMRRRYIGSSDAAAICGHNPNASAYDVWAEKTGRVSGFNGNAATEIGTYFESGLLAYAGDRLKATLSADQFFIASDEIRAANLDGLILGSTEPAIVEGKTVNMLGFGSAAAQWGEEDEGANGVPAKVLIQVAHQFGVIEESHRDVRTAWVVTFIGGVGFRLYRVDRDDALVDSVREAVCRFMIDNVRGNRPPDDLPSIEVYKSMIREPGKIAEIRSDLVTDWLDARSARLAAEKAEDETRAALMKALGDAEIGDAGPLGQVTYLEAERKGYVVEATTYRTLRHKLPKAAKAKR